MSVNLLDGIRAMDGYLDYLKSIDSAQVTPLDLERFQQEALEEIAMKFKHGTCKICMGPNTLCTCWDGISDYSEEGNTTDNE